MKKILFVTGTRADYGKIKSLIKAIEESTEYEAYIFVSGMHLAHKFGSTYKEIVKDGYKNIFINFSQAEQGSMSYNLGNVICDLTGYVSHICPDMILVHGDRIDALAGAIVGALNNIRVAHIEGGELSGTIDESMRHAITKFAHIHLVCNEQAKQRLIQLGEEQKRIHIIGSPDIDIMLSDSLPTLEQVKQRYAITFQTYAVFMYHPVTTEFEYLNEQMEKIVSALLMSQKNYIIIYPNNDYGSEIILAEYEKLKKLPNFRIFPSLRFEFFLTLLRNAEFIIGNSSAGIRESGVYGIPAIDIGSRQSRRYSQYNTNIQHVREDEREILTAISKIDDYKVKSFIYGQGNSTKRFMEILNDPEIWNFKIQKNFVDIRETLR